MPESTLITCPAPLDMLRRGSPVVHRRCAYILVAPTPDNEGELCFVSPPRNDGEDINVEWGHVVDTLEMDLTDATGRAHAAWWVAGMFNMNIFCVAPILWHREQPWVHDWILEAGDQEMAFGVQASLDDLLDSVGPDDWSDDPLVTGLVVVPALAHLDPTDDTRLPDGSRRVDALALKAVVEHLISQQETTHA